MSNTYFQFKQFRVDQELSGMKVTTDACLFGGWVVQTLKKSIEPKQVLDIGTGTGLLSLMVAQATNTSHFTAIEINEDAYKEASFNFKNSPWSERLTCIHTSIQAFETKKKFDCIICNPPFFHNSQKGENLNKNQALHSGDLTTQDLLSAVCRLLHPEGHFYLLLPEHEMNAFIELANSAGLFTYQVVVVRNIPGAPAFRKIGVFSFKKSMAQEGEIIIRTSDRRYTSASWNLLKSYYLEYNNPKS